ncbi:hypothetical protein [Peribacillus sp. R9-11]|uniref:hypothetical protein n=1 Tax=Peribacillus sp. R9-11 TaxID=3073271 RepID=UPI002868A111|nr:hypothetical protein [Peribacillus sp. R9-11]WMX58489.1 hypothetical protein RE409_28660 [Peribacillus sp. R9-11]
MVYRPTVRYPDVYKNYIENVYKATDLDRNQIIRLALFVAAHSKEYKSILQKHKIADVPLPCPDWGLDEEGYWTDQNYIKEQNLASFKITDQGGIKIILG